VKIGIFAISQISLGKHNVKDSRLDQIDQIVKAKKKTYVQVELMGEDAVLDTDAILTLKDCQPDLILKDLEFVETRLTKAVEESEKELLNKLKSILEKEEFIFNAGLSAEEKQAMSGYGLITNKPIAMAEEKDLGDIDNLLARTIRESDFISFFTTTGGNEARAWLIKKGASAWEAAGQVHSDIQRGFIRAEIMSFNDFMQAGSEAGAKQAGKMRLEQKDYIMQDGDVVNFRFNK